MMAHLTTSVLVLYNVAIHDISIATFEDTIDVSILSSSSTPAIKQDLSILGMTYTQFTLDDWSTYL